MLYRISKVTHLFWAGNVGDREEQGLSDLAKDTRDETEGRCRYSVEKNREGVVRVMMYRMSSTGRREKS